VGGRFSFPGKPVAWPNKTGNRRKRVPPPGRYGYPTTGKRF
jgi:hypothetical protein